MKKDKDIKEVLLSTFDKLVECNYCKELLNLSYPHNSVYCSKCNRILNEKDFTVKIG